MDKKIELKIDKNDDIFLDDLKPEHIQIITSESEGVLYEWDSPAVAIRIIK